ncbi:hypothetical protein ACMFMG_009457 [Clarireedia jacksonii]
MLTMKLTRNTAIILNDANGKSTRLESDDEVFAFLSESSNLWLIPDHQITRFIARTTGIKVQQVHIILQTHAHDQARTEVNPAWTYQEVMTILEKLENRMKEDAVIKRAGAHHGQDFRLWLKILAIRTIKKGTRRANLEKILVTQQELATTVEILQESPDISKATPVPSEAETEIMYIEDPTPSRSRRINFQASGNMSSLAQADVSHEVSNPQPQLVRYSATPAGREAGTQISGPQISPPLLQNNIQFGSSGLRHRPTYAQYQYPPVSDDRVVSISDSVHQHSSQSSASQRPAQIPNHVDMRGFDMEVNHQSRFRNIGTHALNPIYISDTPSGIPPALSDHSYHQTQPLPMPTYTSHSAHSYHQPNFSNMHHNHNHNATSLASAHALPLLHYQQSLRPLQLQRQLSFLAGLNQPYQALQSYSSFASFGLPAHDSDGGNRAYSQTANSVGNGSSAEWIPSQRKHLRSNSRDNMNPNLEQAGSSHSSQSSKRSRILGENLIDGMQSQHAVENLPQRADRLRQNHRNGVRYGQAIDHLRPQTYSFGGSSGVVGLVAAMYDNFLNEELVDSASRSRSGVLGDIGVKSEAEGIENQDEQQVDN